MGFNGGYQKNTYDSTTSSKLQTGTVLMYIGVRGGKELRKLHWKHFVKIESTVYDKKGGWKLNTNVRG